MNIKLKDAIAKTNISEDDLNHSIEQIWHDLDGQVSQAQIREVAVDVAIRFQDATVSIHIPLYVRHLAREWLKENIIVDR